MTTPKKSTYVTPKPPDPDAYFTKDLHIPMETKIDLREKHQAVLDAMQAVELAVTARNAAIVQSGVTATELGRILCKAKTTAVDLHAGAHGKRLRPSRVGKARKPQILTTKDLTKK